MSEGTLARPQAGVAKMREVSASTGQVGGQREALRGGVYRHPATGQEIIALDDPITGDAQARGYVRAGFEWVRDVEEGEVKIVGMPVEGVAKQAEKTASSDDLKGILARLAALESENTLLREQNKQSKTEQSKESEEVKAKSAASKEEGTK